MSEPKGILLGYVSCGTVEVISAAADLDAIHDSEVRRCKCLHGVISKSPEKEIPVIKSMIDPGVVSVAVLCFVRADGEVVAENIGTCVRRLWKEFQVVQRDWIDGESCCAIARGE
jgi:hypothetical protein